MRQLIVALLGALLLASATTAEIYANDISNDFNQLSALKKAEAALEIAKMVDAGKQTTETVVLPTVTVDEVEPWLKLIDRLGEGLVGLAHDLGVEANELVKTPVGMVAMGLIIYHVMGDAINEGIDVVLGIGWFFLTTPFLVLYFYKAVIPIESYVEVTLRSRFRWVGDRVVVKPIRKKMELEWEVFGPGWLFVILLVLHVLLTLCIGC